MPLCELQSRVFRKWFLIVIATRYNGKALKWSKIHRQKVVMPEICAFKMPATIILYNLDILNFRRPVRVSSKVVENFSVWTRCALGQHFSRHFCFVFPHFHFLCLKIIDFPSFCQKTVKLVDAKSQVKRENSLKIHAAFHLSHSSQFCCSSQSPWIPTITLRWPSKGWVWSPGSFD